MILYNGIINIYKEAGFTSHDVVAKLRGILGQKKIGHTGTLDPDAVGVLPVCLGKATKLCDLIADKSKEYQCVMELGVTTDTEDRTGEVLTQKEITASEDEICQIIYSFQGAYNQVPPMYSALKVNGRKLYELAREGKVIERKAREVVIHSIDILAINLPFVTMNIHCSKGTYIRSLCRDIGGKLGCGACMKSLQRTRVNQFTIDDALTLEQVETLRDKQALHTVIRSVESMFPEYPEVVVKPEFHVLVHNGNPFSPNILTEKKPLIDKEPILVYDSDGMFIGIYEYHKSTKQYQPVKLFFIKYEKELQWKNSGVVIGKFEGMHLGHQALLKKLESSHVDTKIMFTFAQNPGIVLHNQQKTILTNMERRRFVEHHVDQLIEYPFDEAVRHIRPLDFIKRILVEQLDAKKIIVGDDFRFGYQRQGDVALLKEYESIYDYETIVIPQVIYKDKPISSTRIKATLDQGEIEEANRMLGYCFYVEGNVIKGNQIGRTLGVPTANLLPEDEKYLPPNGVYFSRVLLGSEEFYGITNIGNKPTIIGERPKNVETHIFNFDRDIYGQHIRVELLSFERPEMKYESLDQLKQQLQKDIFFGTEKYQKIVLDK